MIDKKATIGRGLPKILGNEFLIGECFNDTLSL
jgi:hypothetical protein